MSGPIGHVIDALICPHCGRALRSDERRVLCPLSHSYDLAKQGYLNLLGRSAPQHADSPAMVAARQRFLDSFSYRPIIEALARHCPERGLLLDVGAGPGWYATQLLKSGPERIGLAMDISVAAARVAARAHPRLASIVADTWQPFPLKDGAAAAVTCIFAPRNFAEFRRVLAPGGTLLVVTPTEHHMQELRSSHGLLGIGDNKLAELERELQSGFTITAQEVVSAELSLTEDLVADLIAMGPNAFHRGDAPTNLDPAQRDRVPGWRQIPRTSQASTDDATPPKGHTKVTLAVDLTVAQTPLLTS